MIHHAKNIEDALIRHARTLGPYECGKFAWNNGFHRSDAWVLLNNRHGFEEYQRGMRDAETEGKRRAA